MGALPKRKVSQIRRDRRRAHYLRLKMPTMNPCPQCGTLRLAHHVCSNCGTYAGTQVIEIKEKSAK
jgi:large subunit ribosomal protein L32